MPVTIKSAAMKYKDASGAYVGIDAISETTTSEQVAAITAAGAAQQTAIEAKGAETRDSIPDDYTALSDEVDSLRSAFNASEKIDNSVISVIENETTQIPLTWVNGFIDRNTGEDNWRDSNQRSVGFTPTYGKKVSLKSTINTVIIYLFEYDKDFNYLTSNNGTTSPIYPVNANTAFVRFGAYSTAIAQSELSNYVVAEWQNTNSPMVNNRHDIDVLRNALIDNGVTDEYVVLYDTAITTLSIPNKNAFEIATLDGSNFENNTLTMYAADGTTVLNSWELSPYSGNKRSITNNSGNGAFVKLTNVPPLGIKVTVFTKKRQPQKIRVMQYNIGGFNWGHSGGLSTDVEAKIANYKKFLGEYRPDICGLEEYIDYIDSGSTYAPNATLFDKLYFFNGEDTDVDIAIKSDYDKRSFTNFYTKNNAETVTGGVFVEYYVDVENTELVVVAGAIAAGRDPDVRSEAFENLLKRYTDKTNVVILIDTNVISEAEHTALVSTAESYNYSVANGGYFGTFDTYNLESSYYHKIDNVLVKGNIKIKNVIVPDVYALLSSDHYPFIADLEMLV